MEAQKRRNADLPSRYFCGAVPARSSYKCPIIKGYFEDQLPKFIFEHPDQVAFINIDSDIYSSAKTILTTLNTHIVPGTIIYFDEITGWGELVEQYDTWQEGEYKALLEWLSNYSREVEPVSRNDRYGATLRVVR